MSHIQTFVLDGSEAQINDINGKLKFISRIKVGQKVDTDYGILQPDNWNTSLYRTLISSFRGEGRYKTLKYIQDTINTGYYISDKYLSSLKRPEFLDHSGNRPITTSEKDYFFNIGYTIYLNIRDSMKGIMAIRQTYSYDAKFGSEIDAMLETLKLKIQTLESYVSKEDKFSVEDSNENVCNSMDTKGVGKIVLGELCQREVAKNFSESPYNESSHVAISISPEIKDTSKRKDIKLK